jgi:hypothetical protein
MLGRYLRRAFGSLDRHPGLTALLVLVVALGIAVIVMTLAGAPAVPGAPI